MMIASATCPTCGWQEHRVTDLLEDDEGCLIATYLECQSCLGVSVLEPST